MTVKALYPGTFDPITHGHADLVARASVFFQEVIVAVGAVSTGKNPMFPLEERIALTRRVLAPFANVRVCGFEGLLADFARQQGAVIVLRGLRTLSDFDYETQLAATNRKLNPDLETLFMASGEGVRHISSSLVREITALGGDVSPFVHPLVIKALAQSETPKTPNIAPSNTQGNTQGNTPSNVPGNAQSRPPSHTLGLKGSPDPRISKRRTR